MWYEEEHIEGLWSLLCLRFLRLSSLFIRHRCPDCYTNVHYCLKRSPLITFNESRRSHGPGQVRRNFPSEVSSNFISCQRDLLYLHIGQTPIPIIKVSFISHLFPEVLEL